MESYKNIHKDETIYIIASGKSVDYLNISFFSNKITIGVNQSYKKFISNYMLRKEHVLLKEILDLNLNTTHFVTLGNCGHDYINDSTKKLPDNLIKLLEKHNGVLVDHDENKYIIKELPSDNKLVVSSSTITTAIHLAAYMGAKYIILVGHDCGTLDGEPNFNGYHNDSTYSIAHGNENPKEIYKSWLKEIEEQTIIVKKLLKEKYGCEIYSLNPFINFGLEGHKYEK